jgi:DNA polymerase-3 subunit gamma/tau
LSSIVNAEKKTVQKQEEVPTHVVGAKMTVPVTQALLEQYWTEYSEMLKAKGKTTDASAFAMNKPVLVEENTVTFTVHNAMAQERLNADKTSLMDYLRGKLRNNVFTLEIILSKEEGEAKIYTTQDKFKRLAELNPALNKLRQTFDLDLDY